MKLGIWQKLFPSFDLVKACKQSSLAHDFLIDAGVSRDYLPEIQYTRELIEDLKNGYNPNWKDLFEESGLNRKYQRLYEELGSETASSSALVPFDDQMCPVEGWEQFLADFPVIKIAR